jgi:hypothetical protein
MTVRSVALVATLLVVAPLIAATVHAQGVEYAAGTTRYRMSTTTKGSQTSPMGNQDFKVDAKQLITVNLAKPSKDTVVATVTLDSLSIESSAGQQDLSRLLGAKFVTWLSPTGKFYSTKSPDGGDPVLAQVTEGVSRFLPTYRRDLKRGLAWSDTTSGKVNQQGMEVDRTIISNFKVLDDTVVSGEKAFKVSRTSTVKAAGTGTAQGQPIALESATSSDAIFFLSPRGVYLGGRQNDDVSVKVTFVGQGAEVNIKQLAASTIEAIK